MPPKPQFKFVENEKVLCYHGPLLYEAKIIESEIHEKLERHKVHYLGWSRNWDEWVPETRVLKYNEENIQKQKDLMEANDIQKAKKKKKALDMDVPSPASSIDNSKPKRSMTAKEESSKKRIKEERGVESELDFTKRVEVKIALPDEMKDWLVDDWDLIIRQKKLLDLPARSHPSADSIFDEYLKSKKSSQGKTEENRATELVAGLKEYFNTMIGYQLLYKFERPQYDKLCKETAENVDHSAIYGLSHLCRLFVKLGHVLVFTDLNNSDMTTLIAHIQDFLQFVVKKYKFDPASYVTATPEYVRKTLE